MVSGASSVKVCKCGGAAPTWEGESLRLCLPFFFLEPRGVVLVLAAPSFSMKLSSSSTERSSCCRFSSIVSVGAAPSLISFCSSSRLFCNSCNHAPMVAGGLFQDLAI